jgi:dCMP deaminase
VRVLRPGRLARELGLYLVPMANQKAALEAASRVGARSSCVRRQVGAVLMNHRMQVIGVGWNREREGSCVTDCPRARSTVPSLSSYGDGPGKCISMHAEMSALNDAWSPTVPGMTMAVTYQPCEDCALAIAEIGMHVWIKERVQ